MTQREPRGPPVSHFWLRRWCLISFMLTWVILTGDHRRYELLCLILSCYIWGICVVMFKVYKLLYMRYMDCYIWGICVIMFEAFKLCLRYKSYVWGICAVMFKVYVLLHVKYMDHYVWGIYVVILEVWAVMFGVYELCFSATNFLLLVGPTLNLKYVLAMPHTNPVLKVTCYHIIFGFSTTDHKCFNSTLGRLCFTN